MADYSEQTLGNPSWIKRFSHRSRFSKALELMSDIKGQRILDYGAGDGSLVKMLWEQTPDADYFLFEPVEKLRLQAERTLSQAGVEATLWPEIPGENNPQFDTISCLEVLEHLTDEQLAIALEKFSQLIDKKGRVIISVPIETGLTALFKNTVRALLGQNHESSSFRNTLRATFGQSAKVPRIDRNGYIDSHLGFDFHVLEKTLLKRGWIIERRVFTPFPLLGGLFNSQVFYCLKKP